MMDKDKIHIFIPKTNKTKEIIRNYEKFLMAHIKFIGSGYGDGEDLGNSERIEVTKDGFKIITDKNEEIIYSVISKEKIWEY